MNKGKKKYDNEKVIFGRGELSTRYTDPQRGFLLFFKNELDELRHQEENLKVLDVGCGAGAKAKALKAMFPRFDFQGCDISREAIKEAKKNPLGVDFFVADAQKLPVKSEGFDVVIMNSVLDHTQKPKKAVRGVNRALKKGGLFLVTGPLEVEPTTIHGQLARLKSFRKHRKDRCGHLHAFSKKSMLKLINEAGFRVEKVVYDWFYFAQIVDVVYYPFLALTGKGPELTLDSIIIKNKSLFSKALRQIRNVIAILQNLESSLTYRIPLGWFIYIKAVKS